MAFTPPVQTVYVPFTQLISYCFCVTGEVAVTVNVPVAEAGIAAATLSANSQLVVEFTATLVEPVHSVEPAGGNASTGVPVGVFGALAEADVDVEGFAEDAAVEVVLPAAVVEVALGAEPPANQRYPPRIAARMSKPSRIMTPRAPEKFARAGPAGAGTLYGRFAGSRSASGVPGAYGRRPGAGGCSYVDRG